MHPEVDTAVAGSRDQHRLRSVPRALLPRSLSTHGWHYPDESDMCWGHAHFSSSDGGELFPKWFRWAGPAQYSRHLPLELEVNQGRELQKSWLSMDQGRKGRLRSPEQ